MAVEAVRVVILVDSKALKRKIFRTIFDFVSNVGKTDTIILGNIDSTRVVMSTLRIGFSQSNNDTASLSRPMNNQHGVVIIETGLQRKTTLKCKQTCSSSTGFSQAILIRCGEMLTLRQACIDLRLSKGTADSHLSSHCSHSVFHLPVQFTLSSYCSHPLFHLTVHIHYHLTSQSIFYLNTNFNISSHD